MVGGIRGRGDTGVRKNLDDSPVSFQKTGGMENTFLLRPIGRQCARALRLLVFSSFMAGRAYPERDMGWLHRLLDHRNEMLT